MAHLRKVGGGYQIQYYLNHKKRTRQFPKNTPEALVKAEFKRLEADLALHKAGIKRFGENPEAVKSGSIHPGQYYLNQLQQAVKILSERLFQFSLRQHLMMIISNRYSSIPVKDNLVNSDHSLSD